MTEKYREWKILESLPDGWIIDKTAGSPCRNTVFITNGKSVLNGQKRSLLKVSPKQDFIYCKSEIKKTSEKTGEKINHLPFPAKTVNTLARKKFQEQILKEIMFDLMVCEIERWDKKQYIKELQKLLNSIDVSRNKHRISESKQINLFE